MNEKKTLIATPTTLPDEIIRQEASVFLQQVQQILSTASNRSHHLRQSENVFSYLISIKQVLH